MKIAIIGSRDYPNMERVKEYIRKLDPSVTIVSGGRIGVDTVVFNEALSLGMKTKIFRNNSNRQGRNGMTLADQNLLDYCDQMIIFWNGIDLDRLRLRESARLGGKLLKVYRPAVQMQTGVTR